MNDPSFDKMYEAMEKLRQSGTPLPPGLIFSSDECCTCGHTAREHADQAPTDPNRVELLGCVICTMCEGFQFQRCPLAADHYQQSQMLFGQGCHEWACGFCGEIFTGFEGTG